MGTPKISQSSLFLLVTVTWLLPKAGSITYWGDVEALKELKNAIDPNSVTSGACLSSWDFSLDPCDNLFTDHFTCGFRCDITESGTSRLTELALDQAGYSGSLTTLSWDLPYLQTLELSNNNFYGQIPDSLSNLTRLSRLILSRNWFSGEIPNSVSSLSQLEELYLDNNMLQGKVPESFNGLFSLKRLELQSNKLSAEFPMMGSLKNLNFLDASDNAISGEVPARWPPSLVEISMRNNSLEGTIPESFKNLGFLQVLDLSHNKLSGSVPSLLFSLPSLQQLTLSFNNFTSVQPPPAVAGRLFPASVESELIAVDLSNNRLQGFLPYFMALMPKLSALSLENNKFSGMIPTQFAIKAVVPASGISPFERLFLGGNYLFGPIPGPLMGLQPGSVNVTLNGNCLYRCPVTLFFCRGGDQKSLIECKSFSPVIP